MKASTLIAMTAAMMLALTTGAVQAQKDAGKSSVKPADYASAETATYKEMMPGVSMAVVWGDPQKGAHGTYTKFVPGYDAGMHSHSSNLTLVVIKGAYLYKDEAGEKRVGAGDVLHIPSGHKHWSGGDKSEGALFYEQGSGKFDKIDVKKAEGQTKAEG
jgi:quercetin dioxygenase-like cupin family protein